MQSLIREKYFDVNLLHLSELLQTNEHLHVKRETLRKWAHDIHHVKPATTDNEYRPMPVHVNLDDICITKAHRKIRNDHNFTYKGQFYFIESPIKHSIAHQKIEIRNVQGKQFEAYFADRKLTVSPVNEPTKAPLTISNNGFLSDQNNALKDLGISQKDIESWSHLTGPELAKIRAEKVAELTGGKIIMADSAVTNSSLYPQTFTYNSSELKAIDMITRMKVNHAMEFGLFQRSR
ncbi:hypothetical protein [Glaciecola sp. 1036]|uniref:hypothetical protein n=1 Tax=Alteromonadaceae TaxID=72275 RepID=UPI003CFFB162